MANRIKNDGKKNGKVTGNQQLRALQVMNEFTGRLSKLWNLLAPNDRRDVDKEAGWPLEVSVEEFRAMYDREAVAARVVGIYPDECFKLMPEIYETEDPDPDDKTPFEESWDRLEKDFQLRSIMHRADVISGIGSFGVIVLGIGDRKDPKQPLANVDDYGRPKEGTTSDGKVPLLYVNCYAEDEVRIDEWNKDPKSSRFGKPEVYSVNVQVSPEQTKQVKFHWTRVIHIADNVKSSSMFGMPRMQQVYNRLLDIRKIAGGSAEGVWRNGFPIIVTEADSQLLKEGATVDEDSLKEQMDLVMQSLQRQLLLKGASAKTLGGNLSDSGPQLRDQLELLCIALGVPLQKFIGSEVGMRSAEQNSTDWNDQVNGRRNNYVTPFIIVPVVERLIAAGCLASPGEDGFQVWWPDPNAPTPKEQAEIAKLQTEAMGIFVEKNIVMLMAPELYLTMVLGWTDEEAKEAKDSTNEMFDNEEDDPLLTGLGDPPEDANDGNAQQQEGQGNGGENQRSGGAVQT